MSYYTECINSIKFHYKQFDFDKIDISNLFNLKNIIDDPIQNSIKKNYNKLLLKYHPDKVGQLKHNMIICDIIVKPENIGVFMKFIGEIYEQLSVLKYSELINYVDNTDNDKSNILEQKKLEFEKVNEQNRKEATDFEKDEFKKKISEKTKDNNTEEVKKKMEKYMDYLKKTYNDPQEFIETSRNKDLKHVKNVEQMNDYFDKCHIDLASKTKTALVVQSAYTYGKSYSAFDEKDTEFHRNILDVETRDTFNNKQSIIELMEKFKNERKKN